MEQRLRPGGHIKSGLYGAVVTEQFTVLRHVALQPGEKRPGHTVVSLQHGHLSLPFHHTAIPGLPVGGFDPSPELLQCCPLCLLPGQREFFVDGQEAADLDSRQTESINPFLAEEFVPLEMHLSKNCPEEKLNVQMEMFRR